MKNVSSSLPINNNTLEQPRGRVRSVRLESNVWSTISYGRETNTYFADSGTSINLSNSFTTFFPKNSKFVNDTSDPCINWDSDYTSILVDRVYSLLMQSTQTRTIYTHSNGRSAFEHARICQFEGRYLISISLGYNLKLLKKATDYRMLLAITNITTQMDNGSKESEQGLVTQESDKASNTIITRDAEQTVSVVRDSENVLEYASTEPTVNLDLITNRWMPLNTLKVTTTMAYDSLIKSYYIPETFYTEISEGVNLLPFETFIYSELDTEIKFVVNANKFQVGKVIAAVKFDSFEADKIQSSVQAMLCRPHVILDLSTNNEGVLQIPFRYHRALVRNVANSKASIGVRPAKYATVDIKILSPLKAVEQQSLELTFRVYFRFKRASFAAMSYRVPVVAQMEMGMDLLKNALPSPGLRTILGAVEPLLSSLGTTKNRDKPTDFKTISVVPRPRLGFCGGKGVIDSIPLRNDPHTLTSYQAIQPYSDEPQTTLDIARIWGLRAKFTWSRNDSPNKEMFNMIVDPTARLDKIEKYVGNPTPLEYASSMYNFWAGPIEVRLDFVSNAFHTGSIMITADFGRPSDTASSLVHVAHSSSTYTKTFHLGDQKTVNFTIPYIYDTVWRRTAGLVHNPYIANEDPSDLIKWRSNGVYPVSNTKLRVWVVNELRPVATVPADIEVLVFWRASPNYMLHSLKQCDFKPRREDESKVPNYVDFPWNTPRVKGSAAPTIGDGEDKHDYLTAAQTAAKPKTTKLKPVPRTPEQVVQDSQMSLGGISAQMDNGEKESQDPTHTFQLGRYNLSAQSSDSQVSIKDIMRRPTLLMHNKFVAGTNQSDKQYANGGLYIPIRPPCRTMQHQPLYPNEMFSRLIGQTPQAALLNLFRFWRGGMRYTIVVKDGTSPIYITHMPHSGVARTGNVGNNLVATPVFACGLTTEILSPQVNPTGVFEVPYDTENNWTLIMSEDVTSNMPWRDRGDYNAGHIIISPYKDTILDVWWSGADDFEVCNFYGTPECTNNSLLYQYDDKAPRAQMDQGFPENNVRSSGSVIDNIKKYAPLAMGAIPVIGQPLAVGYTVHRAEKFLNQASNTLTNVNKRVEEAEITIQKVNNTSDTLTHAISEISKKVEEALQTITKSFAIAVDIGGIIKDSVIDLIMALVSKSWCVFGLGIVRIITKVFPIGLEHLTTFATGISNFVSSMFGDSPQAQAPRNYQVLLGVLAGMIGLVTNTMVLSSGPVYNRILNIFEKLTSISGIGYLNHMIRFVTVVFDALKELILNALGYVDPEVAALKRLCESSHILNEFVTNAQHCTSEANVGMFAVPQFRHLFYHTVVRAYQIQRALSITETSNSITPQVAKLCQSVISTASSKFTDLRCSPVRYEPFVICISGKPGIGKSFMIDSMLELLIDSIGVTRRSSGLSYTRIPGAKHWDGMIDQYAVVYDDWLNISEIQSKVTSLTELYHLKSTCPYTPPMASLEEKKIKINPFIVVLVCNDAFPDISNLVPCQDAVYRRRDVVIEASLLPEYENIDLRSIEHGSDFPHLTFKKYKSSVDPESLSNVTVGYDQMSDFLIKSFQRYHAQERINVTNRLEQFYRYMQTNTLAPMGDPFELFYSAQEITYTINQNAWLPSEQLEMAVYSLLNNFETVVAPVAIVVPSQPDDIFAQAPLTNFLGGFSIAILPMVMDQTAQGLHALLQKLRNMQLGHRTVVGQCNICLEEDIELVAACNDGTLIGHGLCQPCYTAQVNTNGTICPVCRNSHVSLLQSVESGMAWAIISWFRTKGLPHVIQGLIDMMRILRLTPMRLLITIYSLATSLVATADAASTGNWILSNISLARIDRDVAQFSIGATLGTRIDTLYEQLQPTYLDIQQRQVNQEQLIDAFRQIPLIQMERGRMPEGHDWGEIPPVVDPRTLPSTSTDRFVPEINAQVLELLCEPQVSPYLHCCHAQILAYPQSAQLVWDPEHHIKAWQVFATTQDGTMAVRATEHACMSNTTTCPFADRDMVPQFYYQYMTCKRPVIRQHLVNYSQGVQREYNFKKLPSVYVPQWMSDHRYTPPARWWEWLSDKFAPYKKLILILTGIGGACGVIYAGYSVYQALSAPLQATSEQYNSGETRQLRRVIETRNITPRVVAQADDVMEIARVQTCRNYVTIKIDRNGENVRQMTAVGIVGKYAIIPWHYVLFLEACKDTIVLEPTIFTGEACHLRTIYKFSPTDFVRFGNLDLALFRVPNSYPSFKNLKRFFQTDDDACRSYNEQAEIVLAPTRLRNYMMVASVSVAGVVPELSINLSATETMLVSDLLKYDYSEQGACGSLIIMDTIRPIKAMHIAGVDSLGVGYGTLITQELLDQVISTMEMTPEPAEFQLEKLSDHPNCLIFDDDTAVDYLGVLPKNQRPHVPKKSKIVPSTIQKYMIPQTRPCFLDAAQEGYPHDKTPLYYGCLKHGIRTEDWPRDEVKHAADLVWDLFISKVKSKKTQLKPLTWRQAILGFDGEDFYDPMKLNTSAGFPWSTKYPNKTTKTQWITVERDEYSNVTKFEIDPELVKALEQQRKERSQGKAQPTIFVDTLKDERRKIPKAMKQGGTRVFCASPIDHTIALRRSLLHFIAAFSHSRLRAGHAVGINAKGPEWTELYRLLTEKSHKNVITLDYSNFGPGFNAVVANEAVELIIRWVKENIPDEDITELRTLLYECTNSVHVAGGTVYQQFSGSPSGMAVTTIINSIVNMIYFCKSFIELTSELGVPGPLFDKNVCLITYGDDLIATVTDFLKDYFNAITIQAYLRKYKIAATSTEKELEIIPPFVKITEASFLQRTFIDHPYRRGTKLGPLKMDIIDEIPQWTWMTNRPNEATYENVNSAMMEYHAHGPQVFENKKKYFNQLLLKDKNKSILLDWKSLDEMWFQGKLPPLY